MSYVDPSSDKPKDNNSMCFGINNLLIAASFLLITLTISIPILSQIISTYNTLSVSNRPETAVDRIISKIINNTRSFVLPTRYSVPDRYLLPPSDQGGRGVCWAFATIFLLESQYRANGIEKGYLNQTEYVSFSKQAYAKYLFDKCLNNKEVAACQHGGFGADPRTADDHKLDAIYYFLRAFPEIKSLALPESVCPYNGTIAGEDICEGLDNAMKSNPIEFKIKSHTTAHDLVGAKRLLIEKQRPIGLGTPIPSYIFYAPCDSSSYSQFDVCLNKESKCPEGFASEYCYPIKVDSRIRDGTFVYLNDFARTVYAGGHAVNVVGYNDDWVHKARVVSEMGMSELKGGLIIHNSWNAPGHSVEYLMGRRSEENEAVICPNHLSPMNWIPASEKCMKDNKGDYTKCGSEFERVRGKSKNGLTKHADLLKCINEKYCNKSRNYVIGQRVVGSADVFAEPLFNGLDRVQIISWTSEDDIKAEFVDFFPFWAMKLMLEPADVIPNDPLQCGYWMYPYETTNIVNRKTWSLIDTFHVSDVEFEFTDQSYAKNMASGKDYSLFPGSTHNFTLTDFNGPLPYEYVYP